MGEKVQKTKSSHVRFPEVSLDVSVCDFFSEEKMRKSQSWINHLSIPNRGTLFDPCGDRHGGSNSQDLPHGDSQAT